MAEERENHIGTIEHTRKMLAFLETLSDPSEAVEDMIRQYRAEIAGYEYDKVDITSGVGVRGPLLPGGSHPPSSDDEFHDVAGANVP